MVYKVRGLIIAAHLFFRPESTFNGGFIMICRNCGKEIPNGNVLFCPICGAKQEKQSKSAASNQNDFIVKKGYCLTKTENIIILIIGILALFNGASLCIYALFDVGSRVFELIIGFFTLACGAGVLSMQRSTLIIMDVVYVIVLLFLLITAVAFINAGLGGFVFLCVLAILEVAANMVMIHIAQKALSKKTQAQRNGQ